MLHYSNNASTTLTQSIATGDTTLHVASTALFPQGVNFGAGDGFYVTLENSLFGTREVCFVTGMTVTAFTVLRGQDGTIAQEFDASTTIVERRAVAADFENLVQDETLDAHINDADAHPQYASDADVTAAVAAHVAASDPHTVYAKDSDVTAAIAAHVAAVDPHSQYTTSTELAAAFDSHIALSNPHSQYSTNTYVTSSIATHAAASNPHPSYLKAASTAEITAKSSSTVGLTPSTIDHLWGRLFTEKAVSTSPGASAEGKFPLLDSSGKLDVSFIPNLGGVEYKGALDAVNNGPPAITHIAGDFYYHNGEDGNLDADWTGVGGDPIALGDQLVYDGANWAIVPTVIDTDQYLRRDGTVGMLGDLDVNSNAISNASIDYADNYVTFWSSVVPGERPAGGTRLQGELYVNLTDNQFGFIDAGTDPLDLLAITIFSASAAYEADQLVVYSGSIYRALTSIVAGAFNPAQWEEVSSAATGLTKITQSAHGFTSANQGAPLRFNGSAWVLNQATAANHHHAILVEVTSVDTFTIATSGQVTVDVAVNNGAVLVAGTLYYCSTASAGKVTSTQPTDLEEAHPVYVGLGDTTAYLVASPAGYAQYDYVDTAAADAAAAAIVGLATEDYVDTAVSTSAGLKVDKAGDTMTGALTVTDATADGHALNRITADGRFAALSHGHELADVSDAGTLAAVDDAPSDSKIYGRYNGSWAEVVSGGGEGGTSDHTALLNRDVADQHPIGAVTGLQTALDAKQATLTGGATSIATANLTASRALMSDGSGKVAVSAVSATELGYLDNVTGPLQTQLDGKVPLGGGTMTGMLTLFADPTATNHAANKNYVDGHFTLPLTSGMAAIVDGTGKFTSHAAVSSTELGYLDGVTSALQTQLDNKQALDADLTAIAALAGSAGYLKKTALNSWSLDTNSYALAAHNHDASYAALGHNHDTAYISLVSTPTEGNFPTLTAGGELGNSVYGPSSFSAAGHNHDAAYAALGHNHDSAYSATGHTHDDRYYTESEITSLLSGYSATSHNHDSAYISVIGSPSAGSFPTITAGGELNSSSYGPASFSASDHNHSGVYQPADAQLTDIAALSVTKGNVIVGDGTNFVSLGVGTNDYVLMADSAQTTGVKWAQNPAGVTDHGLLTGLADDDHTQYALADGSRGSFASTTHNHDSAYISVVSTPTAGNIPTLTAGGELANSAYSPSSFATSGHNHDSAYISVVGSPTNGNFPTLTAGGELANSAYGPSSFQAADADLTSIAGLAGTSGYLKKTAADTWALDTSTFQAQDGDLDAIAALSGTSGLLKKTAANTWSLDTAAYITASMSADLDMNNNDIIECQTVGFYQEYDNGNSGTADTITLTNGMKQKSTLTGNATLTITATSAPTGHYQLRLIQDATGGRSVTWSGISSTQWLGSSTAPAINTAANGQTIVNIFVVGGSVICASATKVGA